MNRTARLLAFLPTKWLERLAGNSLVALGKRYVEAGDMHEAKHVLAALEAGNSVNCEHSR